MMALRTGKIILGLAIVGLASWQAVALRANLLRQRQPAPVPTALAKRGEFIVGVSESGALKSRSVTSVALQGTWGTVVWVAKDGIEVTAGQEVLRLDAKEAREEIDTQDLALKGLEATVGQVRRDKTQDVENANRATDRATEGLNILEKSNRTEREQAEAQLEYDRWQERRAETDRDKQSRLVDKGLAPRHDAELAQQKLRAAEFAVWRSEHDLDLRETQHAFKQRQQQDEIDNARFQAERAKERIEPAVRSARQSVDMKKRDLEHARQHLTRTTVCAPVGGLLMLARTWADEGLRTIKEGDRLWHNQRIADICDLKDMEVPLHIDELHVGPVRVGQEAVIKFEAIPGREFKGEVVSISKVARLIDRWDDPTAPRDLRVFEVVVALRDAHGTALRPGMNADVQIVFSRIPNTLMVPLEALQRQHGREIVYVRQRGGFVAREVVVGRRGRDVAEIVKGLRPGERVAIAKVPLSALKGS
jgi:RND family efflux transporter MFP subunit